MTPATLTPTPLPPSLLTTAFRWVRETLIRWHGPESGRHAWWRRRWVRLLIATFAMAVAFWAVGEHDLAYAGACSADQTIAAPDLTAASATNPHMVAIGTSVKGLTLRSAASSEAETYPVGAGMRWTSFGLTMCGDLPHQANLQNANMLQDVVLTMLQGMGAALTWLLSGGVTDFLLGQMGGVVTFLHKNVFLAYAPIVVMFTLLTAVLRGARRGSSKIPLSALAWAIVVTTIASALSTPLGLQAAKGLSDQVGEVARRGAASAAGLDVSSTTSISTGLIDSIVAATWSHGVLGDLADQPAPTTLTMVTPSSVPDISDTWTISLNPAAIPAAKPGSPTYGELWRWTQAFTSSESAYMRDHTEYRCKIAGASPATAVLSSLSQTEVDNQTFCYSKWAIHTALLSMLKNDNPAAYDQARGSTSENFKASLAEVGAIPAVLGLMIIASLALIAEAEFALLMLVGWVFYCLMALRDPAALKRFGEQVTAALVRRVAIGVVVGAAVAVLGRLAGFLADTWAASPWLSAGLLPLTESLLGFVILIAAYQALGRVGDALHSAIAVEKADDGPVTKGARRVGLAAVSAAAGAVGAAGGGAGAMLRGAAAGVGKSALSKRGSTSIGGAVTTGAAGGRRAAHEQRMEAALTARTGHEEVAGQAQREAADAASAAHRTSTEAAWARAMDAPELDAARAPAYEAAAGELDAAERRLADAQAELARAIDQASRRATERAAGLIAKGVDPERARARAWDEGEKSLAPARTTVRDAEAGHRDATERLDRAWRGEGTQLAEKVRKALDAGQAPERVAATYALDGTTLAALQEYARDLRAASELFYRGAGHR